MKANKIVKIKLTKKDISKFKKLIDFSNIYVYDHIEEIDDILFFDLVGMIDDLKRILDK